MAGRQRRLSNRASDTAEINAAQRAAETLNPPSRRLIVDEPARHLVQRPLYRFLISRGRRARLSLRILDLWVPGLHTVIILRARYVDALVPRRDELGFEQVVLLGAGYDSTAFRHDLGEVPVFEVDAPTTQAAKRAALERAGLEPRGRVEFVACDFEQRDPAEALGESAFDAQRPALVVWLGVSYYLGADSFRRTVRGLGELLAPGSRLVLDYMDPAVIDGSTSSVGARRLARSVARRGEPYRLGFAASELDAELDSAGFEVVERCSMTELAGRFAPVWCRVHDFISLVCAERSRP